MQLVLKIVVYHVGFTIIGVYEVFQILEVLFLLHVSKEFLRVRHFAGLTHWLVQGPPDFQLLGVAWADYKLGLLFELFALRGFQDC